MKFCRAVSKTSFVLVSLLIQCNGRTVAHLFSANQCNKHVAPVDLLLINAHMFHVLSLHDTKFGSSIGQNDPWPGVCPPDDPVLWHSNLQCCYYVAMYPRQVWDQTRYYRQSLGIPLLCFQFCKWSRRALAFQPYAMRVSKLAMVTCSIRWRFLLNYGSNQISFSWPSLQRYCKHEEEETGVTETRDGTGQFLRSI